MYGLGTLTHTYTMSFKESMCVTYGMLSAHVLTFKIHMYTTSYSTSQTNFVPKTRNSHRVRLYLTQVILTSEQKLESSMRGQVKSEEAQREAALQKLKQNILNEVCQH